MPDGAVKWKKLQKLALFPGGRGDAPPTSPQTDPDFFWRHSRLGGWYLDENIWLAKKFVDKIFFRAPLTLGVTPTPQKFFFRPICYSAVFYSPICDLRSNFNSIAQKLAEIQIFEVFLISFIFCIKKVDSKTYRFFLLFRRTILKGTFWRRAYIKNSFVERESGGCNLTGNGRYVGTEVTQPLPVRNVMSGC